MERNDVIRRGPKRIAVILLALALVLCIPAFASGATDKAERTILLYCCGADLETNGGMATYNLKQILGSNFSSDDDINFIIMTRGKAA